MGEELFAKNVKITWGDKGEEPMKLTDGVGCND